MHYGLCENGGLRRGTADRQALICVFSRVVEAKAALT